MAGPLADAERIVADAALHFADDTIGLRYAIRAADEEFIAFGMPRHALQAAAEGAGSDGRDIVDEALGLDLGELGAHVAAHADELIALVGEDGVEHPIAVRGALEDLLAGFGVDGAQGVVGAAEGNHFAIRRPAHTVDGVEADGGAQGELALFDVPDLHFAHLGRASAGGGEALAIGRETHALDAFAEADEAGDEFRAIGFPEEHFVEARDGEQGAIGRKGERGDDRRALVDGRVVEIEALAGIGRRVVDGAFTDPAADELDIGVGQRGFLGRHLGFAAVRRDLLDEKRLVRFLGDHSLLLVLGAFLAAREELGEIGHHIAALGLGGLVAALALGLKDRADLLVIADRGVGVFFLRHLGRGSRRGRDGQRRGKKQGGKGAAKTAGIHVQVWCGKRRLDYLENPLSLVTGFRNTGVRKSVVHQGLGRQRTWGLNIRNFPHLESP